MNIEMQQQAIAYLRSHRDTQLATVAGDQPMARAMYLAWVDDDLTLWYATARDSNKAKHISANPKVCVTAYDQKVVLRITARAEFSDDIAQKEKIWSPVFSGFFKGATDPNLVLLKVTPVNVEYWEM